MEEFAHAGSAYLAGGARGAREEMDAIRVDHFSTRVDGGAGAGARRLHEALLGLGVDSRFWYWRRGSVETPRARRMLVWGDGPWLPRATDRLFGRARRVAIKSRLREARRGAPPGHELFTPPVVGWATPFSERRFSGQVVHLHWVSGLVDYPTFFRSLPAARPVVWTLRDMNPLTGGCHYSDGCQRYRDGCGSCPQLGTRAPDDVSALYFSVKRAATRDLNLHVAAPSRWMLDHARSSPVFAGARSFHWMPTGIETDVFVPRDRTEARAELGIPPDGLLLALGAERLDNVRKGASLALTALARLETDRDVRLVVFGEALPAGALPADLPVYARGFVADPGGLATIYAAADCFVLPSLEDNLPKTGLEALSCGTPVVAFDSGGVVDYVLPGRTGLLARTGDADDLAHRIDWLLAHDEERLRMGGQGRELILEQFDAVDHARAYRALYEAVSGLAKMDRCTAPAIRAPRIGATQNIQS